MDCEMPVLDGYDATLAIREFEKAMTCGPTTIMGLSGHDGDAHRRKCKQVGMNDTYTKPVKSETLAEMTKKHIK